MSLDRQSILQDYRYAFTSRMLALVARKEVASGRAGFGIFGEGKELPQVAMARSFAKGDWRSGYYRDQTFMLATQSLDEHSFFAQLYADANRLHEPHCGGRQMSCHYASRYYDDGTWHDQTAAVNVAADMSCTSGQLPRLIGLGYASKLYRHFSRADHKPPASMHAWTKKFSHQGNEVAFGTIGDAATAEGHFWETINAMGVLQIPVALSIWDDGYGISVPHRYQSTKGSIGEILQGFANTDDKPGIALYQARGWNYPELVDTYDKAISQCRSTHNPCILWIQDLTQPLGHSTSGSASRYKSAHRLEWEQDHDCLPRFRSWILENTDITHTELTAMEGDIEKKVLAAQKEALHRWQQPLQQKAYALQCTLNALVQNTTDPALSTLRQELQKLHATAMSLTAPSTSSSYSPYTSHSPLHSHTLHDLARNALQLCEEALPAPHHNTCYLKLSTFNKELEQWGHSAYTSYLYCNSSKDPHHSVPAHYASPSEEPAEAETLEGYQVIQRFFQHELQHNPRMFIIGEDVGALGGVNLEFAHLQHEFGEHRVTDTGIREATILGQGHGAAMRGLRPVVDIQYLDYLLFCLQGLSDDIATMHYRSCGGQVSPVIIRTKGHRLMGIWHAGSPMGMILHSCRGIVLCTPRNMVQACGMYRTLLHQNNPAIVIEPLNGYRLHERLPQNFSTFTIPLGQVEILREGHHITVVTYGACCAIALQACTILETLSLSIEIIDCQTLLPFDHHHRIKASLQKTHSLIICDEDVPGGASAYILQAIIEQQQAFHLLDSPPQTLTASANRCAYGQDGNYYCKPSPQDLVELCRAMIREKKPLFSPPPAPPSPSTSIIPPSTSASPLPKPMPVNDTDHTTAPEKP